MVGVGMVGLLLMFLSTKILQAIDSLLPWDMSGLTNFFRAIIALVALAAIVMTWLNGRRGRYLLDAHSLHVQTGDMGKKRMRIYDYKNVTSFDMRQSFLGSHFKYGNIIVYMDKLENNEKIVLRNVDDPERILKQMHEASVMH